MIATLKRLDDVLHPVLHRLTLIVPSVVPLEQARGAVSVEPVLASRSIPERSIALRSGLAVSSLDLVGASPHSPVVLTRKPARVTAGDPLPEGCDAVIDATAVTEAGPMILINDSATPGLNTRLAGQDLRPGAVIVPTGRQLTVVVLPGFPTSAMFTFHDVIAPVLRVLAGLPDRSPTSVTAHVPVRIPSEIGRTEFVMVALAEGRDGLVAHPVGKGSGAVTAFSQADGFLAIDSLADALPAGATATVYLFSPHVRVPDLVIMGSHCTGLDTVVGGLARQGRSARVLAVGSLGGLTALQRGECDIAPIHLLDPATGAYNRPYLSAGMKLIEGWRRMQGLVFRIGDARFAGKDLAPAVSAALADPACVMVNRNQGAGTRTLIEGLLKGARPPGYWNQPRSHNAVATAVEQGRADWGVAIKPVADALGLGFIPLADEHYDFAVREDMANAAAIAAFRAALSSSGAPLRALGFEPSEEMARTSSG